MAALSSAPSETPTPSFAVVTLLTSDSYLAGALTTLKSLLDVEGSSPEKSFETVCLVTPSTVGQSSIKALERCFDRVVGVEEITTSSWTELDLLGELACDSSLPFGAHTTHRALGENCVQEVADCHTLYQVVEIYLHLSPSSTSSASLSTPRFSS